MGNTVVNQEDETQPSARLQTNVTPVTVLQPIKRTANSRVVTVIVDEQIQFEVDVTDPTGDLTCGWLLSEVTRKYTIMLEAIQREEFHSHKAKMLQQSPKTRQQEVRMPRQKRRYIVALKTKDFKEGIDSWLNQYERDLSVLRDGTILIAHFAKLKTIGKQVPSAGLAQRRDISIDDFEQMRVVGRGGFSRVILARKKDTGRLYAIKILRKDRLINENQIKPILSERRVLEKLDHPFVIKLHWAFQSERELFFVMDICTGGELFFHLLQQRRFSEKLAKFYMCEILLGFQYMHERNIVYRDIKPENILVDMDGHIRVADFGLSKIIHKNERSYSFCGSPEYLSPEMLRNGEGHDRRLDIYCLGVLLYEMLTGLPPFFDDDHQQMFEKIMYADLILDQPFLCREVKDLLAGMLEKNPNDRYQSITEIMEHPWFNDVDWSQVVSKSMKPPLIPDINSCYFEQDNGEEGEDPNDGLVSSSFYRPTTTTPGNLNKSSIQRRCSYYIHSTVQLQSCIDDRTSFMRSPSQLRQFFDSSALMTNMNDSILDKSIQFARQESINSEMYKSGQFAAQSSSNKEMDGPFIRANPFFEFDYAHPPLAEIQILRVLENHIKRKKKAHLDKARKFKEQLLQVRNQGSPSSFRFREDATTRSMPEVIQEFTKETNTSSKNLENRQKPTGASANIINGCGSMKASSSNKYNPQEAEGNFKSGYAPRKSQFYRPSDATSNSKYQQSRGLENLVQEMNDPPQQIFSDSEVYDGGNPLQRKLRPAIIKKKSKQVPDEHEEYEKQVYERVGCYDDDRHGHNNNAHKSFDSMSEPEQLSDPPSAIIVNEDSDDSDSIGNETTAQQQSKKSLLPSRAAEKQQSAHQIPFQSSDTISIKKLKYQKKKVQSGEYQFEIHHNFESMREQANQSKRNVTSGLSRGIHQSLQEIKTAQEKMDDNLLVSNERNVNSPILSNKLEYAQMSQQTPLEKSHENFQKRKSPFQDLKQGQSVDSGNIHIDFGQFGTCEKQQTFSNAKFTQGSDGTLPKEQHTTSNYIRISNVSEQMSPTIMVERKSKFSLEGSMEEENLRMTPNSIKNRKQHDILKMPRRILSNNDIQIDLETESETTVANFLAGSNRTLLAKDSKQTMTQQPSPQKKVSTVSPILKQVKENVLKKQQLKKDFLELPSGGSKPLKTKTSNVLSPRIAGYKQKIAPQPARKISSHQKKSKNSHSKSSLQFNRLQQSQKGIPSFKPSPQAFGNIQQKVKNSSPMRVNKQSFVVSPKINGISQSKMIPMIESFSDALSGKGGPIVKKQPQPKASTHNHKQSNVMRDRSPIKQMQSFTQVTRKNLGSPTDSEIGIVGITSPRNNDKMPRVRPLRKASSTSMLSEIDDYEDLVADETEEVQPSKASVMKKQAVRESTTGIPSMVQISLAQTGNAKGPISLKALLGGGRVNKGGSVSPDPIKRGGLFEMRTGLLIDRLSPTIKQTLAGRAGFQDKLAHSPLKISSTAQLYKADESLGLSPKRTKLDKVMGSLDEEPKFELQKMTQITSSRQHGQRNNSISKINKISGSQLKYDLTKNTQTSGNGANQLQVPKASASIYKLGTPSASQCIQQSQMRQKQSFTTKVAGKKQNCVKSQSNLVTDMNSQQKKKRNPNHLQHSSKSLNKIQKQSTEDKTQAKQRIDKSTEKVQSTVVASSKANPTSFIGVFGKKGQGIILGQQEQKPLQKTNSSRSLQVHARSQLKNSSTLAHNIVKQTLKIPTITIRKDSSRNAILKTGSQNQQIPQLRSYVHTSPSNLMAPNHLSKKQMPSNMHATITSDLYKTEKQPPSDNEAATSQLKIQLVSMQAPFNNYSRDNVQPSAEIVANKTNDTRMVGYTHDFLELPDQKQKASGSPRFGKQRSQPVGLAEYAKACAKMPSETSSLHIALESDDDNSNSVSGISGSHRSKMLSKIGKNVYQVPEIKYNCFFDPSKESIKSSMKNMQNPMPYSRIVTNRAHTSQMNKTENKSASESNFNKQSRKQY